jgi:hypothetical protein
VHSISYHLEVVGPLAGALTGIARHSVVWTVVFGLLIAISLTAPHIRGCISDFLTYRLTNKAMDSSVDRNKTLREYGKIRERREAPPP